jgi:hypothetical protein
MRLWIAKPEKFFEDILGWKPWDRQIEILHSVRDNRETMVQSCHAAGKTWFAAGLAIYWLITRFNGKVITTAPTWRQVQDVLWAKIGSQAAQAPMLGLKPMQTAINMEKDWFARGLSTRQPEKFQGYHGNVLVIVDEASGVVGENLWAAMDGNLTDFKNDRLLAIGNPTDPTGEFYRRCSRPIKGVRNTIKISAYDTPNVRARQEVIPHLISYEFVKLKEQEWGGPGNPLFDVRILGEFPRTGGESLFPLAWLDRAFDYDTSAVFDAEAGTTFYQMPDLSTMQNGLGAIGMDVAAGGDDRNALCYRTGLKIQAIKGWYAQDTTELLEGRSMGGDRLNQPSLYGWVDLYGPDLIYIDALGPGKPIYDEARKHKLRNSDRYGPLRIRPFKASASPLRDEMFANAKAEAYWNVRELLRLNQLDMSMIQGEVRDEIERQAFAIRWKQNAKGQIQIEDKRTMKAREGFSPDELEALIMSLYGAKNPRVDRSATRKVMYEEPEDTDRGRELVRSFTYNFGR